MINNDHLFIYLYFHGCFVTFLRVVHGKPSQSGPSRCDVRGCPDHRVPGGVLRGLSFRKDICNMQAATANRCPVD